MNLPLTNAALLELDSQHIIHPLHHSETHARGRVWVKGEGSFLYDADGKKYIDGLSCLWNVSAGHGRQELADAAWKQMSQLAFSSGYTGGSNKPAIELAERLSTLVYPGINTFYFTSGGGESTDSNIKVARFYWKAKGRPEKTKVIGREWSYHGTTFAAMCATGIKAYWPMFEPRIPGFSHIPSPDPYRYPVPEDGSSRVSRQRMNWRRKFSGRGRKPSRCLSPNLCRAAVESFRFNQIISKGYARYVTSMMFCWLRMKSLPASAGPERCSAWSVMELSLT